MAISPDDLQRRLCEQLCAAVRVERRPDGVLMLASDFEFPDGDRYPIYLSETPGGVRLSDRGDTLTRISYDHDIDAFLAGSRGLLVERIVGEEQVGHDHGAFYVDAPIDQLSSALFRYGRALTRIYDLTLHSRSRAASTFYDDLADLLIQTAGEEHLQRDYLLPDLPNHEAYPIDYRMDGKNGGQVFLYGVPNRDKARLTTIILSHFHPGSTSTSTRFWYSAIRPASPGWTWRGSRTWVATWCRRWRRAMTCGGSWNGGWRQRNDGDAGTNPEWLNGG